MPQTAADRSNQPDTPAPPRATADERTAHETLALDLASTPTAAGREHRVIQRIRDWARPLAGVRINADDAGNLIVERENAAPPSERAPLFITAHMDHPAFTLEERSQAGDLLLSFRGGVLDPYFTNAQLVMFTDDHAPVRARIISTQGPDNDPAYPAHAKFLRTCIARIDPEDAHHADNLSPGDIGRWDLPDAAIEPDRRNPNARLIHADACDDLAPLAAALAAFQTLLPHPEADHVRLLFTRAEEVGFVGAIAACKLSTMPPGSRALLLEASRAFPESPVGGGPIVRVGDRANTFSPNLTAAITKLSEKLRKNDADAEPTSLPGRPFRVQRKLMPGGVCEASAYLAFGYESACVCLPLGNYHNMADLTAVADDKNEDAIANATVAREFVAADDFHDLVTLLTAIGLSLGDAEPMTDRLERLHRQRQRILNAPTIFDPDQFQTEA